MVPTKELSIETMERIVKLIQEGNIVECGEKHWLFQLCLKPSENIKEIRWLKRKSMLVT